ncbi:hypothetical protein ABZY09_15395 [Streptomyces sp. NPDC002928]|uniref:hypothetical protein n=1 Tax=Streptomyces sp. NPDC002928 TaxID=3154440 RepID=UPI0033B52901
MTDRDPLVPALTGMLVDVVWWLESCGDEEVDPDSAVKIMESVGGELLRLPSGQRERLLRRYSRTWPKRSKTLRGATS